MKNCFKYFIHDRKAEAQHLPPKETPRSKGQSLDELPSYTDLFGLSNTQFDPVRSVSLDKSIEKPPVTDSEVLTAKSKEIFAPDVAQCMTILQEASGRKSTEDRRLARLAAKCGGCGTTARVVGTYIAQTGISCGRYMRTIQEKSALNLHSALSLTLEHIKKINPDAAQLFMFFAYFDYADLAYDLIAAANVTQSTWISRITTSVCEYESTMKWLQGYGLVGRNTVIYALNPQIHQWLTQSLRSGPLFSTFSMALRCVASAQETVSKCSYGGRSTRFTHHAQYLTTLPFENMWLFAMRDPSCVDSVILLAHNSLRQKQVDKARALTELALDAPCLTASNMSNLAKILAKQGKKPEAKQLYKVALDLFRTGHTTDSIAYLKTLRRLDRLSKTLSRTDECETILKDVLNAKFKMPQIFDNASKVVRAYAELGMCRQEQKRYDEAIALYRAALEDYENLLDEHDSHILLVYKRMGETFRAQKQFDRAGYAYGRALLGYSEKFGRHSQPRYKIAPRLERVAMAFIATGEGKEVVKEAKLGSPELKLLVYTRWGCQNA